MFGVGRYQKQTKPNKNYGFQNWGLPPNREPPKFKLFNL